MPMAGVALCVDQLHVILVSLYVIDYDHMQLHAKLWVHVCCCCFSGENPSLLGGLKWPKTHDTAIFQAHFTQQQNTCRSRAWYPFHLIAAHSLVNRNFPTVDTFIHFLKDRNNNEINKIKFHRKTKVFSYPILFNNNKKIVTQRKTLLFKSPMSVFYKKQIYIWNE